LESRGDDLECGELSPLWISGEPGRTSEKVRNEHPAGPSAALLTLAPARGTRVAFASLNMARYWTIDWRAERLRWLAAVFLLALAWRAAAWWQISSAWFFEFRIGDAAAYHEWAREIAAGNWISERAFYQAPLYPYCLGLVYATLGESRLLVTGLQCVGGALATLLLCDAGWRWFSKRIGIVSGIALGVYAPAIFCDLLIQKASLDLLLVCWLLWLLSHTVVAPRPRTWWAIGIACGLLALNRENALVWIVFLGMWLALRALGEASAGESASLWRRLAVRRLLPLGLFAGGVLLVLAPVALRNRWVSGEWHLTTSQFGPNFYIGNHAAATGLYEPLVAGHGEARYERADAERIAELSLGRELSPAEVSAYWTRRAVESITGDPAAWGRLMLRKLGLFWNHVELMDTEDLDTYADAAVALRVPGRWVHFGLVAVLAVSGTWCGWKRIPGVRLLVGLVLVYQAGVVVFYLMGRYRLPVVPPLMLLASLGLVEGVSQWRTASMASRFRVVAAMAAMGVLCAWPLVDRDRQRTGTVLNFGAELMDRGRFAEAAEQFRAALARNPGFPEAHYNLGRAYAAQGRLNDAIRYFSTALQLDPRFTDASLNIGNAALELGQLETAAAAFSHTLAMDPREPRAHNGLGLTYAARGEWAQAAACFEEALRWAPDFTAAAENLAEARRRLK
jgi:tetratricopeptide (TPR) repeat protein